MSIKLCCKTNLKRKTVKIDNSQKERNIDLSYARYNLCKIS